MAVQEIPCRKQRHVIKNDRFAFEACKVFTALIDLCNSPTAKLPPWCHSFDLQRNITQADLDAVQIETLTLVEGKLSPHLLHFMCES